MTCPLPCFFISHGGGPWPWMSGQREGPYARLTASLQQMASSLPTPPRAILMVSAHWEAPAFTLQAHPQPPMIYDYYGFPEHTYQIRYPAAGSPELARLAAGLLQAAGLPTALDGQRGYDHGAYTPLAVAWPDAGIPVVQLSLLEGLDPQQHLQAGRALAPLREQGILLIGSGLSYHNLHRFGPAARQPSAVFDQWLQQCMSLPAIRRSQTLLHWTQAPAARLAHPREEHLLPLMVIAGAAEQEAARLIYHEARFMGGVSVSSFQLGNP